VSEAELLAQYGGTNEHPRQAEINTVWINQLQYPASRVQPINLARFQQRLTIGDATINSDDLFSSLIWNDQRGGGQLLEAVEGSTDERYWDGTLNSEHTHQLSLQREVQVVEGPNTVRAVPGIDFNDKFHAVHDRVLNRYDAGAGTWTQVGGALLTAQPTGDMEAWDGKLYIPLGSNGYDVYDPGAGTITNSAAVHPVGFIVWDNKLWTLTVQGGFRQFDGASWTNPPNPGPLYLPTGVKPRRLALYVNESGDDVPFIATDRRVYSYNPLDNKLVGTRMRFPPHPEQGMGFGNWRDEAIYITAGIGVYAYNGDTISAIGLDRNDGIPAKFRGHIAALAPWHNGFTALVAGTPNVGEVPGVYGADVGVWRDTKMQFPTEEPTSSALWNWTGAGWHKWWESDGAGVPTWSYVSIADGEYRLWWGFAGEMYTVVLPKNYHTPEQGLRAGVDRFQQTGYLETSRYDMGMRGFRKLGSHLEVYLRDVFENGTSTGTVTVRYRTDVDPNYRIMGSTSTPGMTVFPMPLEPRMIVTDIGDESDEHGIHDHEHYDGEEFGWIQFLLEFEQGRTEVGDYIPTYTPILDSMILKFVKLPLAGMSWIINIPLQFDKNMWNGRDAHDMWHELNSLATNHAYIPFLHKNDYARVLVSQAAGEQLTGPLPFSTIQFSVIEAKIPENQWILPAEAESGG
jgi:hypothetical protein